VEWLRLKEYGMKNNHIKKLMLIFQDFEELFYEENFKLFNDELKHQLEESMKIDMKERIELYERNKVRIISVNDKEYAFPIVIDNMPLHLDINGDGEREPVHVDNIYNQNEESLEIYTTGLEVFAGDESVSYEGYEGSTYIVKKGGKHKLIIAVGKHGARIASAVKGKRSRRQSL